MQDHQAVEAGSLTEGEDEQMVKLIGLYTYSQSRERSYDIEVKNRVIKKELDEIDRKMMSSKKLDDYRDVLIFMEEHNCKMEQESVKAAEIQIDVLEKYQV